MLILHNYWSSVCSQKVRFCLAEKNLAYENRHVNLFEFDHWTPEYLKLNPKAVVPALVHDAHHPQGLLALAWALRQRDHRKAMALCEQVRHLLHQPPADGQPPAFTGRGPPPRCGVRRSGHLRGRRPVLPHARVRCGLGPASGARWLWLAARAFFEDRLNHFSLISLYSTCLRALGSN